MTTRYNVCARHWGGGGVLSKLGSVRYVEDHLEYISGYPEFMGGGGGQRTLF